MIQYTRQLSQEFETLLRDCDEFYAAVAMISDSGYRFIQEHINKNAKQNYVVGIGLPTSCKVLHNLKELEGSGLFKSRIYKVGELFHPKVYIIRNSKSTVAFVGSGNCTKGGFGENYEINIQTNEIALCSDLLAWFNDVFEVSDFITDSFLASYEPIFERRQEQGNQDKMEIEAILSLPNYYIVNTNVNHDSQDEVDMLNQEKVAAYYDPWKYKIERFKKGDRIFLYSSGKGIIAKGIANGELKKKDYHDNEEEEDEEFYQKLNGFIILSKPISASEVKQIGEENYRFRHTVFEIGADAGEKLWKIK